MYAYFPNILTILRMAAGGLLWYLISIHSLHAALIVLALGVVSDFFDGYFARRYHSLSALGAFLDPLADKVFVLAAFMGLWQQRLVAWWVIVMIAGRDIMITWIRMVLLRRGKPLKTLWLAKTKTVVQFGSLGVFIVGNAIVYANLFELGVTYRLTALQAMRYLGIFVASVTAFSGFIYIPQYWRARR